MQFFVNAHQNYEYDQLCEEIKSIQREGDESSVYFDLKLIQHSYIFRDDDQPSKKDYSMFWISLICKYFYEDEQKIFFGDVDSI